MPARQAMSVWSANREIATPREPVWGVFGGKMYVKRYEVWRRLDARTTQRRTPSKVTLNKPEYRAKYVGDKCGKISDDGTYVAGLGEAASI